MDITLGLMLWLGGFSAGGVGGYYLKGLIDDYRSAEPGRLYDIEQRRAPITMGPQWAYAKRTALVDSAQQG